MKLYWNVWLISHLQFTKYTLQYTPIIHYTYSNIYCNRMLLLSRIPYSRRHLLIVEQCTWCNAGDGKVYVKYLSHLYILACIKTGHDVRDTLFYPTKCPIKIQKLSSFTMFGFLCFCCKKWSKDNMNNVKTCMVRA